MDVGEGLAVLQNKVVSQHQFFSMETESYNINNNRAFAKYLIYEYDNDI